MEKKFFEAFPNLKLEGVQKDLFEQVTVEKITATKHKDLLRIYIYSERLIEKESIYSVEKEIKRQFFPKEYIVIKIYERFSLSGQYNPERLMETYKDSLLLELKECEHMLYTMFRQSDYDFPDNNTMHLVLEDSVIAKNKENELIGILDKVLNERFGFHVRFDVSYKETTGGKYKEDDEQRIKQRTRQPIYKRHRHRKARHECLKAQRSSADLPKSRITPMSYTAGILKMRL